MSRTARWFRALWDAAPVVFAIPVLAGIVIVLWNIFHLGHPNLGWAATISADADAVYLGTPLHQDPALGYSGQLYTPLFPVVIGALLHLHFWTGIPLVLAILSSVALLGLAAWLAVRPGRHWSWLGALGIGAIAWWCVSALSIPLEFEGRADQFAWLLGLGGVVATGLAGQRPNARRLALAIALLSAAFWTKQTTIAASLAAVAFLLLLVAGGALSLVRFLVFVAVLALTNIVVLALLNLNSGGWEWRLNFLYPTRNAESPLFMPWVREGLQGGALAYAFLAVIALVALVRRPRLPRTTLSAARRNFAGWYAQASRAQAAAGPLAVFLAVGFVLAVYFRRKQGGADNQFIGATWGAGLLAAALWSQIGRSTRRSAAASLLILAGFAIVLSGVARTPLSRHLVHQPPVHPNVTFANTPPPLLALATRGLTYDANYGDLNVQTRREVFTNYYNFVDLLAAHSQPLALVRDFENRRFAYTSLVPEDPGSELYASALGKWEDNWLWKLNRVIKARYAPIPHMNGEYQRRPGPERAVWQRDCFGPFQLAGVTWEIGVGGGFWCSPAPNVVTQRGTPAPLTQLRTTKAVAAVSGALRVKTALHQGLLLGIVSTAPREAVTINHIDRDHYTIAIVLDNRPLRQVTVPATDGTVDLALRDGERALSAGRTPTATLHLTGGVLQFLAQQKTAPRVDLGQLHITLAG